MSEPVHLTTLPWERVIIQSPELFGYLRGTHSIWSRLKDGEHLFIVMLNGQEPQEDDGGYYSIAAALKTKGMYP
jgi:hypothetical protein